MAFTVADFHDLIRLLEEHPDWQTELRGCFSRRTPLTHCTGISDCPTPYGGGHNPFNRTYGAELLTPPLNGTSYARSTQQLTASTS
jgi:hypothetical protein